MIRILFSCLLSASVLLVSACSWTGYKSQDFSNASPQLAAQPDAVGVMLADAADRVSTSLETLASVEYARTPGVAVAPVGDAPPELKRAITVNWVGPAEQIAKTLAERASYNFTTVGNAPPVPIVVSIDVENKPVIEVLRDLGLQLGLRGDIRVDGVAKSVELHYPPNTGVGG